MKTGVLIDNGNYVSKLIQVFGKDKVFGVQQRTAKTNNDMNAHFNETGNTVLIDKLMQNMIFMSEIKAGRIGFIRNLEDPELQLFIKHGQNVVIKDEEDETSGEIYKTITRKGGDHYFQSAVYAYVGMKKIVDDLADNESNIQISSLGVANDTTQIDNTHSNNGISKMMSSNDIPSDY